MTGSSTGNNFEAMNTSIDIYFYDQQEQKRNFLSQMKKQQSRKELEQQIDVQSQKSIKSSESKRKAEKSLYHNFQKHSIVTLKYMITVGYLKRDEEASVLARKIWNKFLDCNIKSKEVFTILFGNPQKDQNQLRELFQKYGFGDIVDSSHHVICNAQHILRELAIEQVTQQALNKHLKIRKITRKDGFRLYMLGLIQQLKGGAILKRISKEKSEQINNVVDAEKRETLEVFQPKNFTDLNSF